MSRSAILIQTTVPVGDEGGRLAGMLLDQKLAACVWVLPDMDSHYVWQGKAVCDRENLLVIKTLDHHREGVFELILREHPYECPEIISISADHVSEGYLRFMEKTVGGGLKNDE